MNNERVKVPFEDAVAMLPDGDRVHTFRDAGGILVGASYERADLLDLLKKYGVELSGSAATQMKHGLCLVDEHGPLFIETKELVKVGNPK
jgi:hypothetical protein